MADADLTVNRRRIVLRGISSRAWEHPADRGALVALRELRGFDTVLRKLFGMFDERALRLRHLGSSIRVDHRQFAKVHAVYADAAATLDLAELPELYVSRDPDLGAMTIGMDKPFVVITSGTVDLYDEAELRFVLGHELGHAASGHAVYRTMLDLLVNLALGVSWIPVGSLALRAIVAALYEWSRKAELSADRAGLLAGQEPAAGIRALAKLAGGGDLSDVDITAFLAQAREFEAGGDVRDSVLKLMMLERRSHDFAVARAASLQRWVDDGEYGKVLRGEYPRREDDDKVSISDEVRAAARSYRDAFSRSQDPIAGLVRRLRGRGDMD